MGESRTSKQTHKEYFKPVLSEKCKRQKRSKLI